ncbi:MAG: PhnD/SsuA/transferrin family substrate-binding protein, partial [Desulfobulbaceae bacterium]
MTTMGPNTEELLSNNYFKDQGVDFSTMNIIVTPKDADALYALTLGQVDAALVGQATLNMIGSVNQRVLEATKELITSSPVPNPLLCALPGSADKAEVAKMKEMLLEGSKNSSSPKHLDMLHINGWQKVL